MKLFSYLFFALSIFYSSLLFGQEEREVYDYNKLTAKKEGKRITWKEKSKVSGYEYENSVCIGEWLYYDDLGNLIKKENYKKTGKHQSLRDGIWEYYSPEGERIKVEVYQNGVSAEVQYYQSCIIKDNGLTYDIELRDTAFVETVYRGSIKLSETVYNGNIRLLTRHFSALQQKLLLDHQEYEKKYGNTDLLSDPQPQTHQQTDNLILNPSFENHPGIKFPITSIDQQIPDLYRVSGSPDFYFNNPQAQKDGNSAIGFRVYTKLGNDIEYLALGFKDSLKQGKLYCFKFYLKLGTESNYAAKRIGVIFSNQVLRFDRLNEKIKPHIWLENDWLIYKSGWMRMECTYLAKGGEKFINIGTFYPDKELDLVRCKGMMEESYYYIEDVSVRQIEDPAACNCNALIPTLSLKPRWGIFELDSGKSFVINDVYFNNDQFDLLPTSYSELDKLIGVLQANPQIHIEIQGHTSSVASRDYNMTLSDKRANSVKEYLISKGIAAERLSSVGLGPDFPIAENKTEQGQAKNRRVVFKIMRM